MVHQYVCTFAFDKYLPGDHITDPDVIAKFERSHAAFMVRKAYPEGEQIKADAAKVFAPASDKE